MAETVSWLDMGAGALVLALAVGGAIKGFVRTLFSLVAAVVGVALAGRYGHQVGAENWPGIADLADAESVGVAVGCAAVFVGVLLLGAILGRVVRKIIEGAELGALDRILGLLIGVAKGALIASVATLGLLALDQPALDAAAADSYTLAGTRRVFEFAEPYLPPPIAEWAAAPRGETG